MQFDGSYLVSLLSLPALWDASLLALGLATLAWLLALVAGFLLASARLCGYSALSLPAATYTWFFRSVPVLVVILFAYHLPLYTSGPDPFYAGLLALVACEAAHMAAIQRRGLEAVMDTQQEAGRALGLSAVGLQRLIVVPQAFAACLPRLLDEYLRVLKLTSLVSVVALGEILGTGQSLYLQNARVLETLAAVAVYYVIIVSVCKLAFQYLQRKLNFHRRAPGLLPSEALAGLRAQLEEPGEAPWLHPEAGAAPALQLQNIHKHYGDHEVLKGIELKVLSGQVVSIIGPPGSGKSSLLRCINALEGMDQGEIVLYGESFIHAHDNLDNAQVRRGKQRIGMVFRDARLFAHRTLLDNLALAPRYHGVDAATCELRAYALLHKVGLLAHARRYPHQLTAGQRQRVAIARALALEPDIMLFDEPTAALPADQVAEVLTVMHDLAGEGMTLLMVTDEMDFAMGISDRVVFMEEGQIQLDASPAAIRTEVRGQRVRRFMGMSEIVVAQAD